MSPRCIVSWIESLCTTSVLYGLSIGPAEVWLTNSQNLEFLQTFYAPVIWLHENTGLSVPLERYMEACHALLDSPEVQVHETYPDSQPSTPPQTPSPAVPQAVPNASTAPPTDAP